MELAIDNNQISIQQDDDNLFRMMYGKTGGDNMTLTNDDIHALANLIDTKLDTKLDQRLQPINYELGKMNNRLDAMDRRLDVMDNRLDTMENRIEKIESEISSIKTNQIEFKNELKEVKYKVSETYELALEAWGTSKENRVWLESEK